MEYTGIANSGSTAYVPAKQQFVTEKTTDGFGTAPSNTSPGLSMITYLPHFTMPAA